MSDRYTARFEAYAASLGKPARLVKADHEYINWINLRWAEFNRDNPYRNGGGHSAFDQWLTDRYGVPA